MERLNNKYK